jgi:UDP-2-acetamido-3-amino-2,3-dideoxy-glucuronate N-acetyltransferase
MSDYYAHPTAIIDDGAQIGAGSKIWHFCHIMPQVIIGERCSFGQNVFIANHVTIGTNVKVQNNVSLYEGVTLEDDVFCGPSAVFTNVKTPRSAFPRNTSADYLPTLVKRGASIGANATIVCGVTLGEWCFIGAGAVITKDVPPHALMLGVPARCAGWVCECGEVLTLNENASTCAHCAKAYALRDANSLIRTR